MELNDWLATNQLYNLTIYLLIIFIDIAKER